VRIFHERSMKMIRRLLFLLAFCPILCRAVEPDAQVTPMVEGVQCDGNLATSCELIRRQSGIVVGKELDDIQVENARLRLEGLTRFRSVRIHLIKGSQKHWVIVVIDVVEASPLATAYAAGALLQLPWHSSEAGVVAGRLTDYDLFGSGKSFDVAVVAARPVDGGGSDEYAARVEYRDPRLFGSHTFFFTAGAFYSQSSFSLTGFANPVYGFTNSGGGNGSGVDFSVGMHIGTYSYVTAGYRYLVSSNNSGDDFLLSDGIFTTLNSAPGDAVLFTVGRNTEDDPSFPTHGWLLHAYDIFNPNTGGDNAGVLIRGTWRAGDEAWWTFQTRPFDNYRSLFDDDLGVSLTYSHSILSNAEVGARRARWYVGPGITNIGEYYGQHFFEIGAKAGVRLETKHFGTVNFYVIATYPVHAGY
jgi:outer membrane protein assembly factor BamA